VNLRTNIIEVLRLWNRETHAGEYCDGFVKVRDCVAKVLEFGDFHSIHQMRGCEKLIRLFENGDWNAKQCQHPRAQEDRGETVKLTPAKYN
jgi:hypothetical protein